MKYTIVFAAAVMAAAVPQPSAPAPSALAKKPWYEENSQPSCPPTPGANEPCVGTEEFCETPEYRGPQYPSAEACFAERDPEPFDDNTDDNRDDNDDKEDVDDVDDNDDGDHAPRPGATPMPEKAAGQKGEQGKVQARGEGMPEWMLEDDEDDTETSQACRDTIVRCMDLDAGIPKDQAKERTEAMKKCVEETPGCHILVAELNGDPQV
ncbi:hypothetical protein AAL_05870 [Moelleriella libera RCEF 2490]|uniref:Uncharacterized protein n=1 Tax=Moelleriella libera RCEF 2490 TaxID=1081109 RepID=A0A167ZM08_9HYPO|nr:hypothetical protein AAL_05870 [Moelleriella libera RCEF 2490]